MKKLFAVSLLSLLMFAAIPVAAQTVYYPQDRVYQGRQDRGRGWGNRTYVVNEYRYVRYGRRVFKETYRSTYRRNGHLVSRVLINRERVYRYDRYNDRDFRREGLRFNIFLKF
jgi:hypothetical protein